MIIHLASAAAFAVSLAARTAGGQTLCALPTCCVLEAGRIYPGTQPQAASFTFQGHLYVIQEFLGLTRCIRIVLLRRKDSYWGGAGLHILLTVSRRRSDQTGGQKADLCSGGSDICAAMWRARLSYVTCSPVVTPLGVNDKRTLRIHFLFSESRHTVYPNRGSLSQSERLCDKGSLNTEGHFECCSRKSVRSSQQMQTCHADPFSPVIHTLWHTFP